MRAMPVLETERLIIRPFVADDLAAYHEMNVAAGWDDPALSEAENLALRRQWLEWAIVNHEQLARLAQPPYGDRAVVLKASGTLIGGMGVEPYLIPLGRLPSFGGRDDSLATAEVGLFWILAPAHQGRGYATEAARAVIEYLFEQEGLWRVIATTDHGNHASAAVMRRLGMRVERNPLPEPLWLQVVGVLENPRAALL